MYGTYQRWLSEMARLETQRRNPPHRVIYIDALGTRVVRVEPTYDAALEYARRHGIADTCAIEPCNP